MGNCLRRDVSCSGDHWADEDLCWEKYDGGDSSHKRRRVESTSGGCSGRCVEKDRLLVLGVGGGDEDHISAADSSSNYRCSREIKIKISRKELEKLLVTAVGGGGGASSGSTAEQFLARLVISAAADNNEDHRNDYLHQQRSWRPALQSIPEVN